MYCIQSDSITLKTLGFDGKDEEILNLSGERAAKIKSEKMAEILKFHLINFSDKSGGALIFIKDCDELARLQRDFLLAVTREFPDIKFTKFPEISAQNELPENFASYKFQSVHINYINKSKGNFRATFELDGASKSLFFRYDFEAKMPILRANKDIAMRHILSVTDYGESSIGFDEFNKDSFTAPPASRLISKQNIKSGEILTKRQFAFLSLVKKNDKIQAFLNDGTLSVSIEVTALEDGNLGDVVKVRAKDNKIFQATIVSKKQVMIR